MHVHMSVCVCYIICSHHRYIYKLADLHKEQNSYVEAGYTLLLHAELLQVCNEYNCSNRVTVLIASRDCSIRVTVLRALCNFY